MIFEIPIDWLMTLSTAFTFTTSLTYAGLSYTGREGPRYWLISFLLNLVLILLIFILTYQPHPPNSVPASQTCKNTVESQCKLVGDGNISVPDICLKDDSIMRDAIRYDIKQASDIDKAKVICL